MKQYAVHPGYVGNSYISGQQLIKLYKLKPKQCVIWDELNQETCSGRYWLDFIHLYPRLDGNYIFEKHITLSVSAKELNQAFELAKKYSKGLIEKDYWIVGVFTNFDNNVLLIYEFEYLGTDAELRKRFQTDYIIKEITHFFERSKIDSPITQKKWR